MGKLDKNKSSLWRTNVALPAVPAPVLSPPPPPPPHTQESTLFKRVISLLRNVPNLRGVS